MSPREQRQEGAATEVVKTLRRENEGLRRENEDKDKEILRLRTEVTRVQGLRTGLTGEMEKLRADNQRLSRTSTIPPGKLGAVPDVLFFDLMKRSKKVMVLVADVRTHRIVVANRKAEAYFGDINPGERDLKELVLDKLVDPTPVHTEISQVGVLPTAPGAQLLAKLNQQLLSGAIEPIVEDCFDLELDASRGRVEVEVTLELLEDRNGQPWLVASLYDLTKARKDFLTGLWNKKVLQTVLDREFGRRQDRVKALVRQKCAEAGIPLQGDRLSPQDMRAIGNDRMRVFIKDASIALDPMALLMFDIDRFKSVNDTKGHQVGDQILRAVARRVLDTVRQSDVVARYGGEEFACIAVNTDLLTAQAIGERVRAAIDGELFSVGSGGARHQMHVTISVGVTVFHPSDLTVARKDGGPSGALIGRADAALYRAKEGGRNRVCTVLHGGDEGHPQKAA